MTKEEIYEPLMYVVAGLMVFVGIPFLLYLYMGFFSWMTHDPLNVIDWPTWGTGGTMQQSNQNSHE